MRRSLRDAIRRIAWSGVSLPSKAIVDRSYATAGQRGGYAVDLEIVDRASHERTGELLDEVPLQPLWLAADGAGLYAPPEEGQLVIVAFVDGDRAHPYISAAVADSYAPATSARVGELVLVDGRGHEVRITDQFYRVIDGSGGELKLQERWRLANRADSLKPVLDALIDAVIALTTTPGPANAVHSHAVAPPSVAALTAVRQRLALLLDP